MTAREYLDCFAILYQVGDEKMQREDFTVLYSTHYVSEIAQLADRLIIIDSGLVVINAIAFLLSLIAISPASMRGR